MHFSGAPPPLPHPSSRGCPQVRDHLPTFHPYFHLSQRGGERDKQKEPLLSMSYEDFKCVTRTVRDVCWRELIKYIFSHRERTTTPLLLPPLSLSLHFSLLHLLSSSAQNWLPWQLPAVSPAWVISVCGLTFTLFSSCSPTFNEDVLLSTLKIPSKVQFNCFSRSIYKAVLILNDMIGSFVGTVVFY